MTHTMTRETLSEHYKAIRQRLGDPRATQHTIPRERIAPAPVQDAEPVTKHAPRPPVIRRPALSPVVIPPPSPNARRYVLILHDVATRHGVLVETLTGRSRTPKFVLARHEACYLLRAAGYSWPQIGWFLGNRDHTTALHGAQQHEKRMKGEVK